MTSKKDPLKIALAALKAIVNYKHTAKCDNAFRASLRLSKVDKDVAGSWRDLPDECGCNKFSKEEIAANALDLLEHNDD